MTGVCGWLGRGPTQTGSSTLDAMAAGLSRAGTQETRQQEMPGAALHIRSWPDTIHWTSDDGLLVAIDGEPFWSRDDLAQLAKDQGHGAAAAEAYRRFGADLLDHLHGPFAIAVLHPGRREALLAIDRLGIYAMCFGEAPNGDLVFGTTTDAVRAHPGIETEVTAQAVFNYLIFFVSPAPQTMFCGLHKLQSAQRLTCKDGVVDTGIYWEVPYREQAPADPREYAEELRRLIDEATAKSIGSRDSGKVGAFLSGGLDSSTVCGVFAGQAAAPAKCFTIAFSEADYDESDYARIAAKRFNLDHQLHTLTPDEAAGFLPVMAEAYDEPFGNSSAIPAFFCAQMSARTGTELMLAGDGGDEFFAGNERYASQSVYEHYQRLPGILRQCLLTPIGRRLPRQSRISLLRRSGNYIRRADVPLPDRLYIDHPMLTGSPYDLFSAEMLGEIDMRQPFALLRSSYDAVPGQDRVRKMMRLDKQLTLADNDLRKVVRMCEQAGQQVRFPLLDEALVAFAAGLSTDTLLANGNLRDFYKQAMRDFLPAEILNKPKHGFGMPFGPWMHENSQMRAIAIESLKSFKGRGYLRPDVVSTLIADFEGQRENPLMETLWDVVVLELWLQSRQSGAHGATKKSA